MRKSARRGQQRAEWDMISELDLKTTDEMEDNNG